MNPNNTLYVTTQGSYLRKDHEALVVTVERQEKLRVPLTAVSSIVCFGRISASPDLMAHCAELNIGFCFLQENGRFLCRVVGAISGNVLLRKAQYRASENAQQSLHIARIIVAGKIQSARTTLRRARDDHQAAVAEAEASLAGALRTLEAVESIETLRGIEGAAAAAYFGSFDALITNPHDDFVFEKRSRRPPLNPVNAMLSFAYTLLQHECSSACESVGLDPQVGFLHEERPGRPALSLDIMEEFRSAFADRLALSLINRQQVSPEDFIRREQGAVEMSDDARKTFLMEYQKRKSEEFVHPFTKQKISWGLAPFVQANLLARHLRGDLPAYPAFAWR